MAKGRNLVVLVGNLGQDPQIHSTASGSTIATISVATSESWKDKQSGETQERTEWHRCKAFGRLGEIIGEYARKGRQVYVEGKLRTEKYTDREGVERYSTDIIIEEFQLLGSDPARAPTGQNANTNANAAPRPASSNGNGQRQSPGPRNNGNSYPPPQAAAHQDDQWGGEAPF
ncbi:MAG: single-stranded DNA-binding protein [Rudaea sp.]